MIAILILAHKNNIQLQRLINSLQNKKIDIYIHADQKYKDIDIKNAKILPNRFDIQWGNKSIIKAITTSFNTIKNKKYSHYILISGQDYCLLNTDTLVSYLEKNISKSFVDYKKIGKKENEWNVSNRYTYYHFKNSFLDKISRHIYNKRNPFNSLTPYGGSLWFILSNEVLEYTLESYKKNNYYHKINNTSCIDEILFQTIILNSPYKDNIINKNIHYIDWSDHIAKKNNGNPNILKLADYDKIISSKKLFARKFDINIDSKILDKIDKYKQSTRGNNEEKNSKHN